MVAIVAVAAILLNFELINRKVNKIEFEKNSNEQ